MTKAAKSAEETEKAAKVQLIETVLDKVSKDTFPETPEKKEEYFMTQVAAGEALCGKGKTGRGRGAGWVSLNGSCKFFPTPF